MGDISGKSVHKKLTRYDELGRSHQNGAVKAKDWLHPSIKREREKGRDPRSISRAHAREQLKRAGRDTKQKTSSRACSYSYLKLTHMKVRRLFVAIKAAALLISVKVVIIIVSRRVLLPSSPFINSALTRALAVEFECEYF